MRTYLQILCGQWGSATWKTPEAMRRAGQAPLEIPADSLEPNRLYCAVQWTPESVIRQQLLRSMCAAREHGFRHPIEAGTVTLRRTLGLIECQRIFSVYQEMLNDR